MAKRNFDDYAGTIPEPVLYGLSTLYNIGQFLESQSNSEVYTFNSDKNILKYSELDYMGIFIKHMIEYIVKYMDERAKVIKKYPDEEDESD